MEPAACVVRKSLGLTCVATGYARFNMLLHIERKTVEPDVVVVALQGRLVIGEALTLDRLLSDLVHEGVRKLVLDLAWLSHIDSAGIGAVAKSAAIMKQAGGKLHLAAAGPRVAGALAIAKLEQIVPMYADVDSACAAL